MTKDFDFFNPKAGLSWQIDRNHRLYGSFSVAHKEPTRNNYTDGYFTEHPKAERLFDYELGYTFANSCSMRVPTSTIWTIKTSWY